MSEEQNQKKTDEDKTYTIREFFEEVPPSQVVNISQLAKRTSSYICNNKVSFPELKLYCSNESCEGFRLFESSDGFDLCPEIMTDHFVEYKCKNCRQRIKTYAIRVFLNKDRETGVLYKYGEIPEFGPPTPPKVVSVLGAEKEYYFKGRRSENQGLGIAAFTYYRRVVENQKNKIFDKIILTVQKVDPSNKTLLDELEKAKQEQQFTKAVDSIKQAIPQALLIDGCNPLILLHKALSEGIHAKTDEECLEIATSIRLILTDLVERMSNTVNDKKELKTALNKLLNRKQ